MRVTMLTMSLVVLAIVGAWRIALIVIDWMV